MLVVALARPVVARADEVSMCFNYGCNAQAVVNLSAAELDTVAALFADVAGAADERDAVARAMAWLYFYAGQQSPIWRDRGGNYEDDGVDGRMDCIDHSINTTTWLHLLAEHGWLKHHRVAERVQRGRLLSVHWSARLVETGATQREWAVDTWFLDPGRPASIFPLRDWMKGARAPGTELFRWN